MAVQPPLTSTTPLDKESLAKLKRPEIQALCKANNLRAIGTTGSLIDSLATYFESLTISKSDTKPHVTPKPTSRLRKVLSPKPQVTVAQDNPALATTAGTGLVPLPNGSSLKSKPSIEGLSAKPGVRKPGLRVPSGRSLLNSLTSVPPMVVEVDAPPAEGLTTVVLADPQLLSPANTVAAPRDAASPSPSNRSLASSVRQPVRRLGEATNVKPKSATSKAPARPASTAASTLSLSTSTKPLSAPTRRASLTPSVASQTRSTQPSRPRLSSSTNGPPPSITPAVQTELNCLAASLKALENAHVDQIAALTERIALQDAALQAQNDLVRTLQQTVTEMHELLVKTRLDVLEGCKVDVASCVSQCAGLNAGVGELQKRMSKVEGEVLSDAGTVVRLEKEMGDVDVAMASERDRVTFVERRIEELEGRLDDVLSGGGESTAPTSASSQSFRMRRNSKKVSISVPRSRKQSVVRDSSEISPPDSVDLFSRDRRLSRASISASLHTSTPLSPVPSSSVAFPSAINTAAAKRSSIKPPFSGTKQEFKFPPPPQPKAVPESGMRSRTTSSATTRRTKTPPPPPAANLVEPSPFAGKALMRTPPACVDDDQARSENEYAEDRTFRIDCAAQARRESSSEDDEPVTTPFQPRPTRISTTKRGGVPPTAAARLPAIMVNDEKAEHIPQSNGSSLASVLSDGAVSVSISDLDVGVTTDDDARGRTRARKGGVDAEELHDSLLHQPQPSFGGLTTDDEEFDV